MKKVIGGWILIGIGAFLLLGFTVSAVKEGITTGDIVAFLLFCVGPIVGGTLLIRSNLQAKRKGIQQTQQALVAQREKEIIRLAQKTGGHLTIPDIVGGTSLNTTEAEEIMREMTTKGYVNMNVTDAGVIVYEFYEIAHHPKLEA
jgi:hypothetical protein